MLLLDFHSHQWDEEFNANGWSLKSFDWL